MNDKMPAYNKLFGAMAAVTVKQTAGRSNFLPAVFWGEFRIFESCVLSGDTRVAESDVRKRTKHTT